MTLKARKVNESIVENIRIVRPNHLNGSGRLFGGALMQWIDEVAGIVAMKHTRGNVITASVDHLDFLNPAHENDVIVMIGKGTYTGNTSMEVKVDSFVEARSGERTLINRAYFTMVALGENDKPTCVPKLIFETEEELTEEENARKRRVVRMMRKESGF
ncbi:acyl-CoA hydrolase [Lachnospiraceae bacterium PF1-21]|uniref:Acyl-CoA thioesterase n=1 Tax=Ohessyouella blattaphilus TaxID=2949333 RepID=A0ABT1EF93_9FIRM|nr:acyl-CoA thioesterase [Ohessyouella blattaphilus]MCP1109353.1 acyl-CoA thioesterase [Ohessyouella blattaphilus]MCR8562747.1 acyl-CoA thioesterase [Ohessyouella blattaphilus]MDL2249342.1 acyl-CoA thioesterase [Lachnospiraceae bacterium OttesenSCG-928-J05]